MKPLRMLGAATLSAALLTGGAAAALTADAVWSTMQSRMTALGAKIAVGSQSQSGGKLMLKDVTATSDQGPANVTFTLPEIDLTPGGDGSVTIDFAPKATIDFHAIPKKGGPADGKMELTQSGLKTVVSGTDTDMTFTTSAESFGVALSSLMADGKEVGAKGSLTITGIAAKAHLTGTDPQMIDSTSSAQSLKMAFDVKDPAGKGSGHFEATMDGLNGTGHVVIPKGGIDPGDMAAALAAGYEVKSSASYGQTTFGADVESDKGPAKFDGSVSSGNFAVEMDKGHLKYGGGSKDLRLTIQSAQIPLPKIEFTEAESDFNLLVPVTKSDTPQDFALLMKVIGLGVNKEVWGMFDPTGALPHDPATLIVDLTGQGNLGFNLFDPALAEHPPMDPGKLKSLKVNQLQLTVAGADLTGTGALTFDNSGPVPKPIGTVDLKLTGGNGLMDKLTEMGLLPQDQAAGFKMMLGMFAKPAGDDVMTSEIEFKDDGSILANGQRIQ